MRLLKPNFLITLGVSVTLLLACSSTEPTTEVTLDYETTQWLITGAINVNALDEGATIDLVMRVGGIVNGMLFIPASITGTDDFTANLAGNWVKDGDTVRFNEVSLTFVSDFDWILTPETLAAADSVDGSYYDIVLTRIF